MQRRVLSQGCGGQHRGEGGGAGRGAGDKVITTHYEILWVFSTHVYGQLGFYHIVVWNIILWYNCRIALEYTPYTM